jgi:GNAT superfamily N-acetyltransferase
MFPESITLHDGRTVVVRPIRPSDADLLIEFDERLSERSRYLRTHGWRGRLTPVLAQHLATVDFVRRFAVVAVVEEMHRTAVVAVGRLEFGDAKTAELALVVRDDYQSLGAGTAILTRLLETARRRGAAVIQASVLAENQTMLTLLASKGFTTGDADLGVIELTLYRKEGPADRPVLGAATRRKMRWGRASAGGGGESVPRRPGARGWTADPAGHGSPGEPSP